MKNGMSDVRNHLVAAMELLGDESLDGEALGKAVERAKAVGFLAEKYIGAVKVECDALRLAHEIGQLPSSVDPGVNLIEGKP